MNAYGKRITIILTVALILWIPPCRARTSHTNESELIDESDYIDGDGEVDHATDADSHKHQPVLQRSPQHHHHQQQQSLYNTLLIPNANMQPNPLRLPNALTFPPGAPTRWVQPVGNGMPATPMLPPNPNLPAGGQRFLLMPFTPANEIKVTSQTSASKTGPLPPTPAETKFPELSTQAVTDRVVGRPVDLPPGPAPIGALPGTPLIGNSAQRLIVLPGGSKPSVVFQNGDNSKLSKQQLVAGSPNAVRPLYPQMVTSTEPLEKATAAVVPLVKPTVASVAQPKQQTPHIIRIVPTAESEQMKQQLSTIPQTAPTSNETGFDETDELEIKPKTFGAPKVGRPIGVQTKHGRLLLEPNLDNFCDIRQYSDEQLLSKNLQRVEYFVANLTCSRYFFECAIGQTFLLNCTSKDQVFDINTVNCNFKYNVKSCNEYDHILHCSIREECQQEQFACCAEPQQCIPYTKRCDGVVDCSDGEDENNCPSCNVDEFPCVKSGKCISWDKRCNGIPDECFDQTNLDEQGCGGCLAEKFTCGRPSESQSPTCIDISLRCNGIRDCPRGEDELNCKSKGQKYLLCENQKQSVSKEQWCDGYEDCLDGSDEKYCIY